MAFSPLLAGNVALASIFHAKSPVLGLAGIATFALAAHQWGGPLTAYIARARAGLDVERLRRRVTRRRGRHPDHRRIGEVGPPVWVLPDRPADDPDYRLCIASHPDGTKLAFSDGTTQSASPDAYVRCRPYRPLSSRRNEKTGHGRALETLVRDLARNGSTPLDSVRPDDAGRHALFAAVLWGLVAATDGRDTQRLHALLSDPGPAHLGLSVTRAGQVWLDCDPRKLREADRRNRMADVPAPTTIGRHQYDSADGRLLGALSELLRIPEVWDRPGLGPARAAVAAAVADGDTGAPVVRSAVAQVLTLAGSLVLGVAGFTVYDVLQNFVR
ncbi:hypothetical protein ACWKSP_01575 [Micromonosporaceae bacterium Da 78-11]